ncbi:MAG: rRNA maturation RNase YbeY [Acidimicrobiia bacterium]|nr:rRNA maturation RNase YbeY [Acidimicrobiia bacterium]
MISGSRIPTSRKGTPVEPTSRPIRSGETLAVNISFLDHQDEPVETAVLHDLAQLVLETEELPDSTEVGIMLVTDHDMAGFNRRFMGKTGATDVLALPLVAQGTDHRPDADRTGSNLPYGLGDVIIAPHHVSRQAAQQGVPFQEEMALMVVHGLLHLIGYDHQTPSDAEGMESKERKVLARIGMERR